MEFDYYDFPGAMEGVAEGAFVGAAGLVTGLFLLVYLLALAFSIVSYVLNSVGMYRIAKRRGIHHAWLAWVPVGSQWLLGSISDHYQYVAKKKITGRRKALLILNIILTVLSGVFSVAAVSLLSFAEATVAADMSGQILVVGVLSVVYLGVLGLGIAATVLQYIAHYDLFRSCKPDNAVLFLILGILFNVTMPIFVFICSSSDRGMPVRRPQQPAVQIPDFRFAEEEAVPSVEAEIVEDPE